MELKEINKILVVNLGGIGDILLSTPALRALRAGYPKAKVSMLTFEHVREAVEGLPYIDGHYMLERSGAPLPFIWALKDLGIVSSLRKMRFDLAINMRTLVSRHSALKMKLLFDMIGPRIRAGRDTEGRGGFFDIRIPETALGDRYEMEYDLDLVRALGCAAENKKLTFTIDAASRKKVRQMLAREGVTEGDALVGIHPGGKPSHRWPAECFAETIRRIDAKRPRRFVITGDKRDAGTAERILTSGAAAIDMTGELSLRELGALIERCSVYICNDTASMHIAAALGVPLVAIFGPGYLVRFDPRALSPDAVVMHKETACAPCDKTSCRTMECLNAISPDEVASAALKLLKIGKR